MRIPSAGQEPQLQRRGRFLLPAPPTLCWGEWSLSEEYTLAEEHHSGKRQLEPTPGPEGLWGAKDGLQSMRNNSYSGACWGIRLRWDPFHAFLTSFQLYFVRIPSLSFPWEHPLNTQLVGESHSAFKGPDIRQPLLFSPEFSFPTQPWARVPAVNEQPLLSFAYGLQALQERNQGSKRPHFHSHWPPDGKAGVEKGRPKRQTSRSAKNSWYPGWEGALLSSLLATSLRHGETHDWGLQCEQRNPLAHGVLNTHRCQLYISKCQRQHVPMALF